MKLIPLTGRRGFGKAAKVDDEDYALLSQKRWSQDACGYAITGHRNVQRMHRVVNKTPDGMETDHINHDPLDNQKINLRNCTHGENMKNRRVYRNNKTGIPGVHFNRQCKKWQAYVTVDGRLRHLGLFAELESAATARRDAVKQFYGEFAPVS